jgi:hypothetical protein
MIRRAPSSLLAVLLFAAPVLAQTDPRVGLRPGRTNAGEAAWNLKLLSNTPSPAPFSANANSDIAFLGNYAIQGNFNGFQVWDISEPTKPVLRKGYVCPASQSDVSVYRNLLFVSGEDFSARLDCGTQPVRDSVSKERLRGIRVFDISDLDNPKNVANVQTCRGSHTHSLLVDPKDSENVYVYVSGSAPVRSPNELPGCTTENPETEASALMRLEIIRIPLKNPEQAAIVSSPRIFSGLPEVRSHGEAEEDLAARRKALDEAKARGQFTAVIFGNEQPLPAGLTRQWLDSLVKARGGAGAAEATAADSSALRAAIPGIIERMIGSAEDRSHYRQCHDITLYPAIGLAGGACEGFGFLMDISNPTQPVRLDFVADSNFAYWHSATFNNEGTQILFSDEWGGGGAPKCRANDKPEWGADALFTIRDRKMQFASYYKIPAAQTAQENCVAHNGSLIPIPGRDVMVQAWYQGGISVFDWTDAAKPKEIAYFDRGPLDSLRMVMAGSWSVYWYNGLIVSSEIARGLDVLELVPSEHLTGNEIAAAKTVRFEYFNAQGQPKFEWPATFVLAKAYLDQLERSNGLAAARITAVRQALGRAEGASGSARRNALNQLATQLDRDAGSAADGAKVRTLVGVVRDLATP